MQDEKKLTLEEVNKAFELMSNAKPPTHYTYFALTEKEDKLAKEVLPEGTVIKIINKYKKGDK